MWDDLLAGMLASYAGMLVASWHVALAGALAFGVGLAIAGRTSATGLLAWLLQPLRILLIAALVFPALLMLVVVGSERIVAHDYATIAVGIGVGLVTYLLWRGLVIPSGGK